MVNGPSELNYLFLHQLGFKVNGLNGVYSEDMSEVSPAAGNTLKEFNSLDLGVKYSQRRNKRGEAFPYPDAAVEYEFSYDNSDEKTGLVLERSGDKIAAVLDDGPNETNSVLRDIKWAFDRLESEDAVDSGSFQLSEYSESNGQMIVRHDY